MLALPFISQHRESTRVHVAARKPSDFGMREKSARVANVKIPTPTYTNIFESLLASGM